MDRDLLKRLEELERKLEIFESRRVYQTDIVPGVIKQRHMSESNKWVRGGVEADLPTTGEATQNGYAMYFATDTLKLWIYDGTTWRYVLLA